MSAIQSWSGLPEHIKRQAAPAMLRGVEWQFYGVPVANPWQGRIAALVTRLCSTISGAARKRKSRQSPPEDKHRTGEATNRDSDFG
jgi:hypothetical protein